MARKGSEEERIEAVRAAATIAAQEAVTKIAEDPSIAEDPDCCPVSALKGALVVQRAVQLAMLRFTPPRRRGN